MNLIGSIIGLLSFNEAEGRFGLWLQRIYYVVFYNTTFPVNAMLVLGSVAPYVAYLAYSHALPAHMLLLILSIALFSAYAYGLIYIVNDLVDRAKDERLAIPKRTARHVVGPFYIYYASASYLIILISISLVMKSIFLPALGYSIILFVLSLIHSNVGRYKLFTIFIERFLKFTSVFILLAMVNPNVTLLSMFLASAVVYPLGFTMDYALSGYLRERVKIHSLWRIPLYLSYWLVLSALILLAKVVVDWRAVMIYIILYFSLSVTATNLARILPKKGLRARYSKHVSDEKSRYIAYSILIAVLIVIGSTYVIAT